MPDNGNRIARPAIAAAVSMLGLSLGVTGAQAQKQPHPATMRPQANPQGVLIGLDQPASQQFKSSQYKSGQYKSSQLKSQQLKSSQYKSSQFKDQQFGGH